MKKYCICAPLQGSASIEITAETREAAIRIALEAPRHGAIGCGYEEAGSDEWTFEPHECGLDDSPASWSVEAIEGGRHARVLAEPTKPGEIGSLVGTGSCC